MPWKLFIFLRIDQPVLKWHCQLLRQHVLLRPPPWQGEQEATLMLSAEKTTGCKGRKALWSSCVEFSEAMEARGYSAYYYSKPKHTAVRHPHCQCRPQVVVRYITLYVSWGITLLMVRSLQQCWRGKSDLTNVCPGLFLLVPSLQCCWSPGLLLVFLYFLQLLPFSMFNCISSAPLLP